MKNIEPIRKEIMVEASQEVAFKVFTEKMDTWWPRTHHIGKAPMTEQILEAKPNGRWYATHEDGSESTVGHVITWDPVSRVVLNWKINGNFKYDPNLTTEVDVQFIPEGPKRTRVKFEHRNLDRLGDGKVVESMNEGWGMILDLYRRSTL